MSHTHRMTQIRVHESGATEWLCENCGRHFVMQAEPFKRIVLTAGDASAAHVGGLMSDDPEVAAADAPSGKLH